MKNLFGLQTCASRAKCELEDIEREEFILHKNMLHDAHRLAYLVERRKHLQEAYPVVVMQR